MSFALANPPDVRYPPDLTSERVMGSVQGRQARESRRLRQAKDEGRSASMAPRTGSHPISMEALISMIQSPVSNLISLGGGALTGAAPTLILPPSIKPASATHLVATGEVVKGLPEGVKVPTKRPKDVAPDAPIISVDLEHISTGAGRMVIRWPESATGLTDFLSQKNETASTDDLIGPIQTMVDGTKKKVIPLFIQSAEKIHHILKVLRRPLIGKLRPYWVRFSDEYEKWYQGAVKSRATLIDAASLLLLKGDEDQTSFPFCKIPLYPWQTVGFQFINSITERGQGTILADDTGLGKTITVAAHLASMGYKGIVACPKSLVHLWKRKIEMSTNLTVAVLVSGEDPIVNLDTYDVIIVGYSMLKKYAVWPLVEIAERQRRVFIMDEGHYVRNPDTLRSEMAELIAKVARHTICVTATPLVNRVEELHSILKMIRRPVTEASVKDFVEMYGSEDGQRELAKELKLFMVRRLTPEVWKNAPKGQVGEMWLNLSNRGAYEQAEQNFIEWLRRQGADEERLGNAERGKALVKLNYLRQLAAAGKVAEATNILEKTLQTGEQVVIFSFFNDPLLTFVKHFANMKGVNYKGQEWSGAEMITGEVSDKARLRIMDAFQAGKLGLLCIGTKAGGVGIDLPIARFGYFLDLPWTPADFTQCTGRLLRLGQERDCQFIKMLAQKTIDQRMEEIIQGKAGVVARTLDDAEFVGRVTALESNRPTRSVVADLIASYMNAA